MIPWEPGNHAVVSAENAPERERVVNSERGVQQRHRELERRFWGCRWRTGGLRSAPETWFCEQRVAVGDSICWKHAKTLGKTKNAERGDSRRFVLTVGSCFSVEK